MTEDIGYMLTDSTWIKRLPVITDDIRVRELLIITDRSGMRMNNGTETGLVLYNRKLCSFIWLGKWRVASRSYSKTESTLAVYLL